MADFTKTIIVDTSGGGDSTTIQGGVDALGGAGGVVIVEQENYTISNEDDTVKVPSNVTIIRRGNVIIEVDDGVTLFKNEGQDDSPKTSNDRIVIHLINKKSPYLRRKP